MVVETYDPRNPLSGQRPPIFYIEASVLHRYYKRVNSLQHELMSLSHFVFQQQTNPLYVFRAHAIFATESVSTDTSSLNPKGSQRAAYKRLYKRK